MVAERNCGKADLPRRKLLSGLAAALGLVSGMQGTVVTADEARKTGQTTVTKLLENERVEVVRMVSAPGDKGAMKKRPDRLIHVVRGAKVRFHYPDGKTEDVVWKAGDVLYEKADNRRVENIDTNDLEYISVHIK